MSVGRFLTTSSHCVPSTSTSSTYRTQYFLLIETKFIPVTKVGALASYVGIVHCAAAGINGRFDMILFFGCCHVV